MTISTNDTRDEYTATSDQTVFNYTFKIFSEDDLNVYITAAGTEANDVADITNAYTVDPATIGDETGGFITFNTGVTAGDLVTIVSDIPAERSIDYQANGDFSAATVNRDFDRVVSLVKQVEDLSNRAILLPESSQGPKPLLLPDPVSGNFLRWTEDEAGIENVSSENLFGINVILDTQVARTYDTLADLVAADLLPGVSVETRGYYTYGDKGSARYIINGPGVVDNYGDHELANGNVAILQSKIINFYQYGAIGNNSTDDSEFVQAAINKGVSTQKKIYISEGQFYFASKLTFTAAVDVRCDATASMRWDGTASNVGILLDFETGGILARMEFPQLFGPGINSSFVIPGYSTNTQVGSTRVGNAINLRGGNRLDLYAHIINGFESAWYLESTATSTVDNVNITTNTSDFCEKFCHVDSSEGNGFAQLVVSANTIWAKYSYYFSNSSGYVNGSRFSVTGTCFSNELGGCPVYAEGEGLVSSVFDINQAQSGYRADSPLDSPILITPSGTMSSTPSQGETITQASSGASGIVVTNADYTLGNDLPFTLRNVSGTFNLVNTLTGSTSGALGAGSVPDSARGFVAPYVAGDQTMGGLLYDAEQTGTLAYFGGSHCELIIGVPMDHPGGLTDGAFSEIPVAGESVRIRDNGRHNRIHIRNAYTEGANDGAVPLILPTTIGEENFDGGVGSARYNPYVYCQASFSSLAVDAAEDFFLYHSLIADTGSNFPVQVIPRNEGPAINQIDIVAFADENTNNRQIRIKAYNRGTSSFTGNAFFLLKVG